MPITSTVTYMSDDTIVDLGDTLATLRVMRTQERKSAFQVRDYLFDSSWFFDDDDDDERKDHFPIDATCRRKMVEWCYDVADVCHLHRETVNIAVTNLDRFLSTPSGQQVVAALDNPVMFQLAILSCLYTAVKAHELEAIDPATFAIISKGSFTTSQVIAMEQRIINALEWRLNPPTATAFVHFITELISPLLTPNEKGIITELANMQIELAVSEYEFATLRPSTVAISSLMNAVEMGIADGDSLSQEMSTLFLTVLSVDCDSSLVRRTQRRLYKAMAIQPPSSSSNPPTSVVVASKTQFVSSVCKQSNAHSSSSVAQQHSPTSIMKARC